MLNYGRIVGQWSRITSRAYIKVLPKTPKSQDFIGIDYLRYSSGSKKDKTGKTAKVEECIPNTKLSKEPPPLPPQPPASPLQGSTPLPENSNPPDLSRPLCEDKSYSCPPNCNANYQQDCYKPGGPGDNDSGFKYWKHLIAALILAGVSTYAYLEWFSAKDKKKEKKLTICQKKKFEPIRYPETPAIFPEQVQYLLVGGGTSAFSAFRSIKALDPTAQVLMISNEFDLPYMRPPLSKEIWYNKDESLISKLIFRQWNGTKRSLFYEPPEFYIKVDELEKSKKGGVAVATGWKVKKIDATKKIAYLQDNVSDYHPIKYDKCLIATGASPKNLYVFESANNEIKKKIIPFRTKEDYVKLICSTQEPDIKNIVVIGGGFLGSELSTSLARNFSSEDKKVYQVFKEKHVLAQLLPEYLGKWVTEHLEAEGVKCVPNVEVHDCRMKNGRLSLTLTNGDTLEADQVVVAIGVKPNTDIAKESNLEVDSEQGGFLVNAELEARSNLWVAGDAACFYDVKLGRRRIEHHDNAVISGKLAGENMVGARKPYLHQSMLWSDIGQEVGFEGIGIINSNLETIGVFAKEKAQDKLSNEDKTSDKNSEKMINSDETKSILNSNSIEKKLDSTETDLLKNKSETKTENLEDDYSKGVIFYLRDKVVVGILLWNIFNRMSIARQVLARETKCDELSEAVKLFKIHEE